MERIYFLCVLIAMYFILIVNGQGELLCANRETVRRLNLETTEYTTILTNLKRSVAVDFHYDKDLILWTDVVAEKIYSSPMRSDGPKNIVVEVCVTPDGLAVDWVHDNLYWTDTGKDVIGVSRLDGKYVTTLFDKGLDEPRAIVLDPNEGLMFWTDWGSSPKIEGSGMDGTHRKTIVSNRIRWPNGLAIDLVEKSLYWADGKTHVLSSAKYDGSDLRVLIDSPTVMRHPFSLDLLGDYLYWSEWSSLRESVYKVNKHSGEEVEELVSGSEWRSLMGIRVYDRRKQPPGVNRCGESNGGCTHLCLPAPQTLANVTYTCACPDGHQASDNCSTVPMARPTTDSFFGDETTILTNSDFSGAKSDAEAIAWGNSTNERHNQEAVETNTVPSGAIIGIILGLLVLTLTVFLLHNKISKRVSLKSEGWTGLDNPVYSRTTEVQEPVQV